MPATMAEMGRPKKKTATDTVRVHDYIGRWVKLICEAEGVDSADLCSPILEEALRDRASRAVAALKKQLEEDQKKIKERP